LLTLVHLSSTCDNYYHPEDIPCYSATTRRHTHIHRQTQTAQHTTHTPYTYHLDIVWGRGVSDDLLDLLVDDVDPAVDDHQGDQNGAYGVALYI